MGTRRKSREIAVQILYQLEINESDIEDAVSTYWDAYQPSTDLMEFSSHILHGVFKHRKDIDTIIGKTSDHWSIRRMPAVDRSILRAAIFEILYCPDIPLKVSIDEAIELAKKFGSDKSSSFVNGILDKVANQFPDKKLSA